MKSLAQIEKEVAKMRKTERNLKPVRARAVQVRVQREADFACEQAAQVEAQKPKRLLFAVLFDDPAPEKKPQPMSKSAKRRLKLQRQFEALCDVQDCFVRRKHR